MISKRKNEANQRVRRQIVEAVIELTAEKPLSMISVTELTKRAGVSRMTFYRNYTSKEEIFSDHLREILTDYRAEEDRLGRTQHYADIENTRRCFNYYTRYRPFISALFRTDYGHMLLDAITEYVLDTWRKPESTPAEVYSMHAYAGALYNCYHAWSKSDFRESVDEMAEILHRVFIAE